MFMVSDADVTILLSTIKRKTKKTTKKGNISVLTLVYADLHGLMEDFEAPCIFNEGELSHDQYCLFYYSS